MPVPVLPDSERITTYVIVTPATGPYAIDFAIYGNGSDYANWVEVWDDGVKLTPVTDWTLDLSSGVLATAARPLTNARITFTANRSGTIKIVGAERPRRTSQHTEGVGVSAADYNLSVTKLSAIAREFWDKFSRTILVPAGDTLAPLQSLAVRANRYLKFDASGNIVAGGTVTDVEQGAISGAAHASAAAASATDANTSKLAAQAAQAAAEAAAGTVANLIFETRTQAIAATIGATADFIMTGGYAEVGDGGGARYKRAAAEPSHAGKFQSNGNTVWWELFEDVTTTEMFGAKADLRAVADGAITATDATFTSATFGFTAADVGKAIIVVGAGAAGAALVTTILSFTNSTTVELTANAGTTVTNAGTQIFTNDTTAMNNADAFGKPVRLIEGKTYFATGQLLLGQLTKQRWFCEGGRGSATIKTSYNAGNCIEIGPDSASAARDIMFENILFEQDNASTQYVFEVRSVRGVRFQNCWLENIYSGYKIGTATRAHYIFEFWACEVHMRAAFHTHLFDIVNSFGQFHYKDSFTEGVFASGSVGFRVNSNVQGLVDHVIFEGGYFSRFDKCWEINHRIGNVEVGGNIHLEGWVTACFDFLGNASFENMQFSNFVPLGPNTGALGFIFRMNITQTTLSCDGFIIANAMQKFAQNQPAIEIAGNATINIRNLLISNLNFFSCIDNADNAHAVVELNRVNNGMVANLTGINTDGAKRYAYMVRRTTCGADLKVDTASIWLANTGTGQVV